MRTILRSLVAVTCIASVAPLLAFGAQRTFVAASGLDTNACSISAPCRSFGQAITQTDAGGEIIVLDSAGYGSVQIQKSLSIIAPRGIYAGITVSFGNGVTITNPGIDVVLRGLTINGQGGSLGIAFYDGASLVIEDTVVTGMNGTGITIASPNSITSIRNTTTRANGTSGISIGNVASGTISVVLDEVISENNGNNGLNSGSGAIVRIRGGSFARNTNAGIAVFAAVSNTLGPRVSIIGARMAANGTLGVWVAPSAASAALVEALIADCEIVANGADGVSVDMPATGGGTVRATLADNRIHKNVGAGVLAQESGSAIQLLLIRNVITRNVGAGVFNLLSNSDVQSSLDNTIDRNDGPQISGTVTSFDGE